MGDELNATNEAIIEFTPGQDRETIRNKSWANHQNLAEIYIIPKWLIISRAGHTFAHTTTVQLSCLVQQWFTKIKKLEHNQFVQNFMYELHYPLRNESRGTSGQTKDGPLQSSRSEGRCLVCVREVSCLGLWSLCSLVNLTRMPTVWLIPMWSLFQNKEAVLPVRKMPQS